MSTLLNNIKKSVKNKALEESFKSDDKVSEVPDPAFDKSAPKTFKNENNEKNNVGTDNSKIEANKGKANNENTKDINHKKYKQVNKASVVSEAFGKDEDDEKDQVEDNDGDDKDNDVDDNAGKKIELNTDGADDDSDEDKGDDNEVDIKIRKVTKEDLDIREHIAALLGSEEELTEDFKSRTQNIFETAVVAAANEVIEEVVAQLIEQQDAAEDALLESMVDKLDSYLDKVVSEWLEENRVEVQRNVRTEIAESFLSGLKTLFEQHYIDIPDDKVDIVEELVSRVEVLESTLDEEINKNVALEQELTEARKEVLVMEHSDGLSDNQKERLRVLSEGIELDSEESFVSQIEDLKESYFKSDKKVTSVQADDEPVVLTEEVEVKKPAHSVGATVASAITKNLRKIR